MSTVDNAWSWLASIARLGAGLRVRSTPADPPTEPIELYEFERCPYCRKVREALSELDLDYITRTVAPGAETKRAAVRERGGRERFPYLVDPNTGVAMYESEAIITYLWQTYGPGQPAWRRAIAPLRTAGSMLASAIRPRAGRVLPGLEARAQPPRLLELYNFEASPYCRKVREALNVLNLDAQVHNLAKKSPRRPALVERGGRMQVPYLVDPNTGAAMYESDDIVAWLHRTYGPR